jgi:plastocyanin
MSCSQTQNTVTDTSSSANNGASDPTVTIQNFAFNPETITVSVGTTVTWVNEDSAPHILHSDLFTSNTMNKGDSFSYTFTTAGEVSYICNIHPSMTGKVVVQ